MKINYMLIIQVILIMIRKMLKSDVDELVNAFKESNWIEKPACLFDQYIEEQDNEDRICLVALVDDQFSGYITLKLKSEYDHFLTSDIPEISDLNVLPLFRKKGVGTKLLDEIERLAYPISNTVGIGVGLYPDYGAAQKLYTKRGYIPDGKGVTYNYQATTPGMKYRLDDDLILWFVKDLRNDR